ncbi:MAG: peptidase M14 [Flavobacteriaceae bacterium]|nr:peptidase M14 [Flavobacteriaceae bacterium]NNM09229.1 peptidase M14 [Flavobacteriaceae bacterium]
MKIQELYSKHFKCELSGRYIHNEHIIPLLENATKIAKIEQIGSSENGLPIYSVTLGTGKKKILAWSQMHGNESTTTKALFDFLHFIKQKKFYVQDISKFLGDYTFVFIPILNPDGAFTYTRENISGVDLNRDALDLQQKESMILRNLFEEFEPDMCLNMHDQRTIYGTTEGKTVTVSFLAPAADPTRTITEARKAAMQHIARVNSALQLLIPGQVGRYDDTFNANCVGDACTMAGVPSILFEAGHFPGDYQREKTRELIFCALLELFHITNFGTIDIGYKEYFQIPENQVNFKDVIIRNVRLSGHENPVSIAVQYQEVLRNGKICFDPVVDSIGDLDEWYGHYENDGNKGFALLNYHEKEGIGEKIVTIVDEITQNTLFNSANK